jgi:type I restriction enzyme S subunit
MSDVDTLTFSINEKCTDKITDFAIEDDKTLYQAKQGSLIVSNAMTVGLSFLLDRPVYINQNVFELNLDETKVNKKFVLWYLNLVIRQLFQTTYTSKYLSKEELGRIHIPLLSKTDQDCIVAQIEPIEQNIRKLKTTIKSHHEIINEVFAREFGFDENSYNEFGK